MYVFKYESLVDCSRGMTLRSETLDCPSGLLALNKQSVDHWFPVKIVDESTGKVYLDLWAGVDLMSPM